MRYVVFVIDDRTEAASADEMCAIDAFNDRLVVEGHWITAGGLTTPDRATVIDNRGGMSRVSLGPLFETSEWVSGFWLIDAPNDDAAIQLAAEGSRACNRKVELRAYLQ